MSQLFKEPHLIDFSKFGEPSIGYISVAEAQKNIPFEIKRVFWTYHTPESIVRGRHAHYKTEQILIAVTGRIIVTTELPNGKIDTFVLENANKAVYVPPNAWHTMQYSHTSVQMVLASTSYQENDYIRDYSEFKKYYSSL